MKNFICKNCYILHKVCKNSKNLFCSSQCQFDYDWIKRKIFIRDTNIVSGIGEARRYLLELNGTICEICKLKTWNNKLIPLVCDHINGDSDDWELINLRMICCNCDALTDTYKNKNRGKGRHYRRERYKAGKSY